MPAFKEKCLCQICICGRHHCDNENALLPQIIDLINNEQTLNQQQHQTELLDKIYDQQIELSAKEQQIKEKKNSIEVPVIIENNIKPKIQFELNQQQPITADDDQLLIETNTQHQEYFSKTLNKDIDPKMTKVIGNKIDQTQIEEKRESPCSQCLNDDPTLIGADPNKSRKTWKTSPEQVEELTRSLSRMRNDEHGNKILEKTVEKAKTTSKSSMPTKSTVSTNIRSKQPKAQLQQQQKNRKMLKNVNNTGQQQYAIPMKVTSTTRIVNDPSQGFLPPLTGFSDSDSSFSSMVCSSEDCDKIHCICETMKKTHLEEHELMNEQQQQELNYNYANLYDNTGINYINMDNDNWIVMRNNRQNRPRDNLKLEGPMELETTFRSTFGHSEGGKPGGESGRVSVAGSPRSSSQKSSQQQLYFNTKRGRNSGNTAMLRSSAKRRIRNRPRTSLKAGGHGYWSTNNRDAYKNFIIVNGEAKTVSDHYQTGGGAASKMVKLPKVITKTTTMTSEEKNRCKYDVNQTIPVENNTEGIPIRKLDGEETRKKIEKKSYITTSEGIGEMTSEKLVKKVYCGKSDDQLTQKAAILHNVEVEDDQARTDQSKEQDISNVKSSTRPYDAYHDNIKDLGLLEINSNPDEYDNNEQIGENYRPHLRKLHETSDDFNLITNSMGNKTVPKSKPAKSKSQPPNMVNKNNKSLIINGHALMAGSKPKPFILPERIQRHKNEGSIPLFEGDMEFTTTNKSTYRQAGRLNSGHRKRTAGRRTLRSGKRRNLFRQSSDSIFARPDTGDKNNNNDNGIDTNQPKQRVKRNTEKTSIYKTEFGDQSFYCPALDATNNANNYNLTGETSGHKYYKLTK